MQPIRTPVDRRADAVTAGTPGGERPLLRIEDLRTHFTTLDGVVRAVDGVSLAVHPGETLGVVGESGCGKSVTAFSVLRLLPRRTSRIVSGRILFDRRDGSAPVDMTGLDANGEVIRDIRGNEIAMIFQEPLTSLSPVHTIGNQIEETVRLHQAVNRAVAHERAVELMEQVGIAMPEQRLAGYPHQFSGGMRQRAMIAMALSCNPSLLIADEPTTALDVTIQAQILELMKALQQDLGMAIMLITHDLGVIAEMADRVAVMYMGRVVEEGGVRTVFHRPLHPYTVGLMRSIPQVGRGMPGRLAPIPGSVPDPFSVPPGCAFYPRCPAAKTDACEAAVALREVEPTHHVRCTLYADHG